LAGFGVARYNHLLRHCSPNHGSAVAPPTAAPPLLLAGLGRRVLLRRGGGALLLVVDAVPEAPGRRAMGDVPRVQMRPGL